MKKILLLALAFLLLNVSLTGCVSYRVEVPEIEQTLSDEFVETFLDEYSVRDPHLYYYTAEKHGGVISETDVARKVKPQIYRFELRLAKINDASMEHFMLGTRYRPENPLNFIGHSEEAYHYVYSHKDAPDPLKDWTVKSIELYTSLEHPDHNTSLKDNDKYKEGFALYLKKEGQLLHSWVNNEDNKEFILDVISTLISEDSEYNSDPSNKFDDVMNRDLFYLSPIAPEHKYTYIVISFKECNGIVWISDFVKNKDDVFQVARYNIHNEVGERDTGVLKNLSRESSEIFDTVFNTLVEVDAKQSTLPSCSDFEKITEGMTYEEVVSLLGLPHKAIDGDTRVSVNYNTVEGKVGQIYFTRRHTGELIVSGTPSCNQHGPLKNTN